MLQLTTKLLDRYITTGSTIAQTPAQEATEKQAQKSTNDEAIWFRDRRLLQLDLHYRWSPVVVDERFVQPNLGSMDAYGAFSDPAPTGYGGVPAGQPSTFSTASGLSNTSSGGVSRTMQYADPYAAVRASIAGAPSALPPAGYSGSTSPVRTNGPPSYTEYTGYR